MNGWRNLLVGLALCVAGCASAPRPAPEAVTARFKASEEQMVIGKHRAEAIYSRWEDEEKERFVKRSPALLAVRTLGLTPEQAAASGISAPTGAVCVVLWDARTGRLVDEFCHLAATEPERGSSALFSGKPARYVGSL